MSAPARLRRRRFTAAPALLLLSLLVGLAGGCTGSSGRSAPQDAPSAQEVVTQAALRLAQTSGLRIGLRTDDLPEGVSGLLEATGSASSAPAFDGVITVRVGSSSIEVPVVSVDGTVHARLPLTTGWSQIDPADYGAPDPAAFLAAGTGFASLLEGSTAVSRGQSVRGGQDNSEVLTEYSASVPGTAMGKVIPGASGESFAAVYSLTEAGELRYGDFTGVFYPDTEPMTYSASFEDYGTDVQISAP